MNKYLPYIVLVLVLVAGVAFYRTTNNDSIDESNSQTFSVTEQEDLRIRVTDYNESLAEITSEYEVRWQAADLSQKDILLEQLLEQLELLVIDGSAQQEHLENAMTLSNAQLLIASENEAQADALLIDFFSKY